jgi:heme oxygenase
MLDAITFLRTQTRINHQLLETQGGFAKIMQPNITLSDYQSLLALLYRFYASVEPALCSALAPLPFSTIYRPRLKLIGDDLTKSGGHLPPPSEIQLPMRSPAEILGTVYVLEGSSLGGQVICRHLQKTLGEKINRALGFYTEIGTNAGKHWKSVGILLTQELNTTEKLEQAAKAANLTFAALLQLASSDQANVPAL